ncbi:MAG: acetyltransferase [Lachnospiraceae bacterium]|nr:acetyltransferase [Lachnospiraceae bacterium]
MVKSRKLLIYGINQQAQQLYYYLSMEGYCVEAFCVDRNYYKDSILLGIPVVYFEEVEKIYPPSKYDIVLSFGYKNMVANRQEKYDICHNLGYNMPTYISKDAKVYTDRIGECVIIYPNVVIEPYVEIGNGCFIESSCSIGHHSIIGNFNFFALGVTTGGGITVGDNCFFGLSSTIVSGKKIAKRTIIGAGVCVSTNTVQGTVLRHSESIKLSKEPEFYI